MKAGGSGHGICVLACGAKADARDCLSQHFQN
ncbi:hypothetical protein SL1157_2104 [Ruegeria lacuscaerulensis ITI-1157]|nr:hypothetical protein SL1157_2104 [Ruegeria lacuscaerulensis ITI-1157]